MQPHIRPAVAAIAGAIANGADYTQVWCYEPEVYRTISVKVADGQVEAFDHDRAAHIKGELPNAVFHYGDQSYIQIKPGEAPGRLEGFDHGSQQAFVAEVRDNHVQLYDFDGEAFHAFTLS